MIGQTIRNHREKEGMTQLELAHKLGYDSMQFVSLFERGLSKVPFKVLGKCFVILNFSKKEQQEIVKGMVQEFRNRIVDEVVQGQESIK